MSRVFNGSTNYIHTPHNAVYDSLAQGTIAAWVFPTAINAGFNIIVVKDPLNTEFLQFYLTKVGATAVLNGSFKGTSGGLLAVSTSTNTVPLNAWTHILMTFNYGGDKKIHLYINGVEVSYSLQQTTSTTAPNDSADGFYFGNDTFNEGMVGRVAEVAVWNTVLSSGQITSAAASTSGVAGIASANLAGYWHLCGAASPEPDATANGDNGTLVGSPTQGPDSPGFNCSGTTKTHQIDAFLSPQHGLSHNIDAFLPKNSSHQIDAWILFQGRQFVDLGANFIFPIKPNNFVKLNATLLQPALQFVNLAATLNSKTVAGFVNLAATLLAPPSRSFVKLQATLLKPGKTHKIDCVVQVKAIGGFVNLNATLNLPLQECCGTFPNANFVKLAAYLVKPGDSTQMPGSGFTPDEDFLSSQVAGQAYKPFSLFSLNGINLIVTAFTMGVISWQTRTRSWLTLVDEAPGGVVTTQQVQTQQLPNGDVLTTTTTTEQNRDTTIITVVVVDSGTPTRTSTSVQVINKNGQITSREIETNTVNGVKNTIEKSNLFTQPPTKDNIQPIKVTTLDGVTHYQWFSGSGIPNQEWAGGDAEGLTTKVTQQQMIPSSLNGQTTDKFGNQIYDLQTVTKETDPTGKVIQTTTDVIGVQSGVGTTTTDTTTNFNGIITTIHKVVTYPDGSQSVSDTTTNNLTGDSTVTTTTVNTDIYGQVTTTVEVVETVTSTGPSGQPQTTVTTTTNTTVGGVTKTTVTTTTNNNFEDAIVNDKVKVFGIQEYTIECVIDELSMNALLEIQIQQQQQYALQELFGQQLGNAQLSYALRQRLIKQYNETLCCQQAMKLQANGRIYQVVFANSASAFRAKYIPGTEPHVYELQMILQERSDLITGTQGFG